MADDIVNSDLDHLVCAIDGISQASYAAYRVGGQVKDAINGLRWVCEARKRSKRPLEIEWQFLVNRHNVHEPGLTHEIFGSDARCRTRL